jgi:hypothetical protein
MRWLSVIVTMFVAFSALLAPYSFVCIRLAILFLPSKKKVTLFNTAEEQRYYKKYTTIILNTIIQLPFLHRVIEML